MNELRALACLIRHKAHVVHWTTGRLGGWSASKCIWCGGSPQNFEDLGSYPFMNVDADFRGVSLITGKRSTPKIIRPGTRQPFFHRMVTHRYLKRFGLTWPQVRDAK